MCLLSFLLLCLLAFALGLVVWPTAGLSNALNDFATDRLGTANYYFRLYTNNYTPVSGSVLGNFTEATFTGYAAIHGNTITWPAATVAGLVAQSTGSNITFNNTSGSPVTVYGVYVTDAANTKLYFAELDPSAPISIPAGGSYIYSPNQQMKSIN